FIGRQAKVLHPPVLMLIAAALLFVCVLLTAAVHYRESGHGKDQTANKPLSGAGGFRLLFQDKYLLFIGIFILVYNWVNTTGEYVLDKTLLAAAADKADPEAFVQAFKGDYFGYVNIIGLILQALVVSRVIRYFGVRTALFVMPVVSFIS